MIFLEVRYRTGRTERYPLTPTVPILIGAQAPCDILVDADGVAPIHCRVSGKEVGFEVTAASPEGVQWNGSTVRNAPLSAGDVLRVGDVDLVLIDDQQSDSAVPAIEGETPLAKAPVVEEFVAAPPQPSQEVELKPLSEEEVDQFGEAGIRPEHSSAAPRPIPEGSVFVPAGTAVPRSLHDRLMELPDPSQAVELDPLELLQEAERAADREREAAERRQPEGNRLQQKLGLRPRRPGEQDLLESPLVLGLITGVAVLMLVALSLWFVLGRQQARRAYDAAVQSYNSGLYGQAIEGFDQFLKEHPQHSQAETARLLLAKAEIEQPLAGTTPDWGAGLAALQEFLKSYRDTEEFREPGSELQSYALQTAQRIALGAATSAAQRLRPALLTVSADAGDISQTYAPDDDPTRQIHRKVEQAVREAKAALLKHQTLQAAQKQMDEALQGGEIVRAFEAHRLLLDRYPGLMPQKSLVSRLNKALELEESLVTREEVVREAETVDHLPGVSQPGLTLARHTQSRSDRRSAGTTIFAVAENCCFGIDAVTGQPRWRREIGFDSPFFPRSVPGSDAGVLLFDTRSFELVLVHEQTGELIWRQSIDEWPTGPPLIHEGQIFLATAGHSLYQIDAGTGRMTTRLKFSQGVVGPPVVSLTGNRLFLLGNQAVLYILTRRPLACERVVYIGQAPGAIQAPPLMLRSYLLLADNDRLESCRLRLLSAGVPDEIPVPIDEARVDGQVHQAPVLRGKQLFVASSGERVTGFTVSETGDAHALTRVATFQVKSPQPGPIYLTAGPDDQVWMASSALRRIQLAKDSLQPDNKRLAVGLTAQPLQVRGDSLYVGRRLPYSRSVLVTEADRQRMTGLWQLAVGETVIANSGSNSDGQLTVATSLGDLFTVTAEKLRTGGFELRPAATLPISSETTTPLQGSRLADGRLAVWSGEPAQRLWVLVPGGSQAVEYSLMSPLQTAPLALGEDLLLATAGRLSLVQSAGGAPVAEDFRLPVTQDSPPAWSAVLANGSDEVLAVTEPGRVLRIELRGNPVPHLAEVAHWEAAGPCLTPPVLDGEQLFIHDSPTRVRVLDPRSLEPRQELELAAPLSSSLQMVGRLLLGVVGGDRLVAWDLEEKLKQRWEVSMSDLVLAGPILERNGKLVLVLQDGRVLGIDIPSGKMGTPLDLQQPMVTGAILIGQTLAACTLDGTLIPLSSVLED